MAAILTYKDLDVWKKSIKLVTDIYEITRDFPKEEIYGLINQMRRAATSIPANIAEGWARNTTKYYQHFVGIARGSAAELETFLLIAKNLNYINTENFELINNRIEEVAKMLNKLQHALKLKYPNPNS